VIRQQKYSDPNPVVRFVIARFFRRLQAVLAELDPHSVLDAGSGEGEMLRRGVLPAAVRPVCLDLRPASLAELAVPHRVCASVLSLPFADRSFDAVTCLEVLEHLDHPAAALRELARYRANLVRARAKEANHVLKTLEMANLKLDSVASDALGVSGWDMLTAVAAGEADPTVLAQMARGKLRQKLDELEQAFIGRVKPHQRLLIRVSLDHVRFLEDTIEQLDGELALAMATFAAQQAALDAIPGIGAVAATAIVAEIGVEMERFPTAAHLASWAGVCPGNKQSGGKRLSGQTTKGNS